jgi:hypothetical protein
VCRHMLLPSVPRWWGEWRPGERKWTMKREGGGGVVFFICPKFSTGEVKVVIRRHKNSTQFWCELVMLLMRGHDLPQRQAGPLWCTSSHSHHFFQLSNVQGDQKVSVRLMINVPKKKKIF